MSLFTSPTWVRRLVTLPVRFYRKYLTRWTPATCRFHPTCSAYCVQAVHQRGILWGFGLTVWRLLRCQPFSQGGYDPVPPGRDASPSGSNEPSHGLDLSTVPEPPLDPSAHADPSPRP